MSAGEFTNAIKENFATAPSGVGFELPVEIIHPVDPTKTLRLINRKEQRSFNVGGVVKPFEPSNYVVNHLGSGEQGLQDIQFAVDNTDGVIGEWIVEASSANKPIEVVIHYYLTNEPLTPQMVPPVTMFLTDVVIDVFQISGKISFVNVKNKKFISEKYTRTRFPSLGG